MPIATELAGNTGGTARFRPRLRFMERERPLRWRIPKAPDNALDAFVRVTPFLLEVSALIRQLPARERLELANMIVDFFAGEAGKHGDRELSDMNADS